MKCEICHRNDAETALVREKDGEEEELYVCRDCANRARLDRQKRSQRTRKITGLPPGVEMSVTEVSGQDLASPPIIGAIMHAFKDMVSGIDKARPAAAENAPAYVPFPCGRTEAAYRVGRGLHLEGLHLIGELEAVQRAFRALGLRLAGVDADGVRDTGHVFGVEYTGSVERVKRAVEDLLAQERNARVRLFEEMPRVFGDSLCRSLAILKNCRLLSPGELFDLLSPLRLAALEKMLDGITLAEIEKMLATLDLGSSEDQLDPAERDRVDAERADGMNKRFEDVMLNERAEEKFL
jgi:hypothetical protein